MRYCINSLALYLPHLREEPQRKRECVLFLYSISLYLQAMGILFSLSQILKLISSWLIPWGPFWSAETILYSTLLPVSALLIPKRGWHYYVHPTVEKLRLKVLLKSHSPNSPSERYQEENSCANSMSSKAVRVTLAEHSRMNDLSLQQAWQQIQAGAEPLHLCHPHQAQIRH